MIEMTTKLFLLMLCWSCVIHGKPQEQEKKGPCIGMDCLHGVLMHGDDEQGDKHKTEDQYLRFKAQLETQKLAAGPLDAEQVFHGALMHGDDEAGIQHKEKEAFLPEIKTEAGPQDMNKFMHDSMHGEEGSAKHDWDNKENSKSQRGPLDADQMMHGILMHGNKDHGEDMNEVEENDPNKKVGPQDAADFMHGVLMHGDNEPGKEHDHKESSSNEAAYNGVKGPNADQLHGILMHGDSEIGQDHSHEHDSARYEVFSDISKILEMDLDDDLLKIIDIEAILEKDKADYAKWIIANPKFQDDTMMGSTYASVSDDLLSDIEIMKRRYLRQPNDVNDDVNVPPADDIPFTADDAASVWDDSGHPGDGEDMRHNLELLGSTEPINARHKVQLALQKAKQED